MRPAGLFVWVGLATALLLAACGSPADRSAEDNSDVVREVIEVVFSLLQLIRWY
jgi:hypothetical protein